MKKSIFGLLPAALLALCVGCSTVKVEQPSGKVWRKGALHNHTLWSDGKSLPETAVATYKNLGYDFMCISDHNIYPDQELWLPVVAQIGPWPYSLSRAEFEHANKLMNGNLIYKDISFRRYVRLRTVKELQEIFDKEDQFLVLPGEEITTSNLKFEGKLGVYQYHFNVFNLAKNFPALSGKTADETIKVNIEQYKKARSNPKNSFFMVNHPFAWAWDVDPVAIINNPDVTHVEVCNNGSAIPIFHIYTIEKFCS